MNPRPRRGTAARNFVLVLRPGLADNRVVEGSQLVSGGPRKRAAPAGARRAAPRDDRAS